MLSAHIFDVGVDAVQTTAIVTLALVLWFRTMRTDRRFEQQHNEIQDAIRSQYGILSQVNDQAKQIVDCQMQIDGIKKLAAENARRIGRLEGA